MPNGIYFTFFPFEIRKCFHFIFIKWFAIPYCDIYVWQSKEGKLSLNENKTLFYWKLIHLVQQFQMGRPIYASHLLQFPSKKFFHIALPHRSVCWCGGAYVSICPNFVCALVRSFEFYDIIMQQRKAVMSNRIVKVTITFIRNILFQKYRKSLNFKQALSNEWTHFEVFFFSLSLAPFPFRWMSQGFLHIIFSKWFA